jgi:hypothetical protein
MKRGQEVTITIDGKTYDCTYISKGTVNTAYKDLGSNAVFIHQKIVDGHNDYSKQAIALYTDQTNPHIPTMQEMIHDRDDENWFLSEYYDRVNAQDHKVAWSHFRTLKKIWEKAALSSRVIPYRHPKGWTGGRFDGIDLGNKIIDGVVDSDLPDLLKEAVEDVIYALQNHGNEYNFEFAKRNLGVTKAAELVLLDVPFNWKNRFQKQLSA